MRIRMLSLAAGPAGVLVPGRIYHDLNPADAAAMVAAGAAVIVAPELAPVVAAPVETATLPPPAEVQHATDRRGRGRRRGG